MNARLEIHMFLLHIDFLAIFSQLTPNYFYTRKLVHLPTFCH